MELSLTHIFCGNDMLPPQCP